MADEIIPQENPQPVTRQAPGLRELGEQLGVKAKPIPVAAPRVRGDDLMAEAHASNKANDEEIRLTTLFNQSLEMIQARGQQDPDYDEKIRGELDGLVGDREKFFNRVIDEGDNFKIEMLKAQNPHWFNSGEAAKVGFFNEASFGQISKIVGGADAVINGRSYQEAVTEQAEKFRLLEKAFPGNFHVGQATAYMIPGSPAKMLFEKAAGIGTKMTAKVMARLASNPGAFANAAQLAAGGAAGSAAVAAVPGAAGTDLEAVSLDRGVGEAGFAALWGGTGAGVLGVAGTGLGKAAQLARPTVVKYGKQFVAGVETALESVSGTAANAMRAARTRSEEIRKASGKAGDIGATLAKKLDEIDEKGLPERDAADQILPEFGEMDLRAFRKHIETPPKHLTPDDVKAWNSAKSYGEWLEKQAELDGHSLAKAPASWVREKIDKFQGIAREGGAYRKDLAPEELRRALVFKSHAATLRENLLAHAEKFGEKGAKYKQLMERVAEKRDAFDEIRSALGRDPHASAEGFIDKLFGRNKEMQRQRVRALDEAYGTSFYADAENTYFAKQLGPGGKPQWIATQATGRSVYGVAASIAATSLGGAASYATGDNGAKAALGTGLGAVALAASSPKIASKMIGASGSMTQFFKIMVSNPEALAKVAGKTLPKAGSDALFRGYGAIHTDRASKLAGQAQDRAAVQVARLNVPIQIRKLADQVYRTLQKDGPISAASTTRIIADSPYFLGLVHYFDVASRSSKAQQGAEGIAKFQQPSGAEGVATPRGN